MSVPTLSLTRYSYSEHLIRDAADPQGLPTYLHCKWMLIWTSNAIQNVYTVTDFYYEDDFLMVCYTVQTRRNSPTFQRPSIMRAITTSLKTVIYSPPWKPEISWLFCNSVTADICSYTIRVTYPFLFTVTYLAIRFSSSKYSLWLPMNYEVERIWKEAVVA
jgi:hypothetical protein